MCGDVEFEVLSLDRSTKVGKITKQWSGLMREMFTDTDYFGVTFPMDLDVNIKAVLLAATFLIVRSIFTDFISIAHYLFFHFYNRTTCTLKKLETVKIHLNEKLLFT